MREYWSKFVELLRERFKKPSRETVKTVLLRTALVLCTAVLLFAVGVFAVSCSVKAYSADKITDAPIGRYDCILVFGTKVSGGQPSDRLEDRLETGVDLYFAGVAPKILMSGDGEHDDYDEVSVMVQYAVDAGVPREDILADPYGLCTYDSVLRAKKVFGMRSFVAVTQEYHLSRAIYIADKNGIEVCGVPADLRRYGGQWLRDIREIAARFKDFYYVQLGKAPSYAE